MASNAAFDEQHTFKQDNQKLFRKTPTTTNSSPYGTFSDDGPVSRSAANLNDGHYSHGSDSDPSSVLILGFCPVCKTGTLQADFTCFGILCAIFLFPLGIICCLGLRRRRCNFCGSIFS